MCLVVGLQRQVREVDGDDEEEDNDYQGGLRSTREVYLRAVEMTTLTAQTSSHTLRSIRSSRGASPTTRRGRCEGVYRKERERQGKARSAGGQDLVVRVELVDSVRVLSV